MPENLRSKMDFLINTWEKLEKLSSPVKSTVSQDHLHDVSMRRTSSTKKIQAPIAPGASIHTTQTVSEQERVENLLRTTTTTITTITTRVETEAAEKECKEIQTSSFDLTNNVEEIPNGTKLIAVEEFNQQLPAPNKEIETLSNDLFDWLVWIDHTLQSQVITVGDLEEIQQAIHKYNVSVKKKELFTSTYKRGIKFGYSVRPSVRGVAAKQCVVKG
jgi:hypothetical protein